MEIDELSRSENARIVSSLPDRGMSKETIQALRESGAFAGITELARHPQSTVVTHIQFTINETRYFVGWDPLDEKWSVIFQFEESGENPDVEMDVSVLRLYDDAGEVLVDPLDYLKKDEEEFARSIHEYIAAYGKAAYAEAGEDPPMFYIDHLEPAELE